MNLDELAVNEKYHKTLIGWIQKNIINNRISKLNLGAMGIDTEFMLDLLVKDDPSSQMMRKNFGKEKLTSEILQKSIAKATLYATVPPALKTAHTVSKIYKTGYKNIFSESESFNKNEYEKVAKNILNLAVKGSISDVINEDATVNEEQSTPDPILEEKQPQEPASPEPTPDPVAQEEQPQEPSTPEPIVEEEQPQEPATPDPVAEEQQPQEPATPEPTSEPVVDEEQPQTYHS